MACEKAFDLAPQSTPCNVVVTIVNPECGHPAQVECYREKSLNIDPRMKRTIPAVDVVVEGVSKNLFQAAILTSSCRQIVTLKRRCVMMNKINQI